MHPNRNSAMYCNVQIQLALSFLLKHKTGLHHSRIVEDDPCLWSSCVLSALGEEAPEGELELDPGFGEREKVVFQFLNLENMCN